MGLAFAMSQRINLNLIISLPPPTGVKITGMHNDPFV